MYAKQKQSNKYSLQYLEHQWQCLVHRGLSKEEIQLKVEKKVGNPLRFLLCNVCMAAEA